MEYQNQISQKISNDEKNLIRVNRDREAKQNEITIIQTNISNNVLIGSNSTILPVKICSKVIIGAGSVVTKNINKSGVYAGNPVKFIRKLK